MSGPRNHTVMERWARSRDGNPLTIRRTIVRLRNEIESTLVYNRAGSAAPEVLATRTLIPAQPAPPAPTEFVVDQGTRILLRLTNSVNTKRTAPGDRVYLETAVPIFVDGRLLIPRGSYVSGTVTESKASRPCQRKCGVESSFRHAHLAQWRHARTSARESAAPIRAATWTAPRAVSKRRGTSLVTRGRWARPLPLEPASEPLQALQPGTTD